MKKRLKNLTAILITTLFCVVIFAQKAQSFDGASSQSHRTNPEQVIEGRNQFIQQNCISCHSVDSSENGVGPSLQGLFAKGKLPASGQPVNEKSIRKQLNKPYKAMPSYDDLTEEQLRVLISYLKTI